MVRCSQEQKAGHQSCCTCVRTSLIRTTGFDLKHLSGGCEVHDQFLGHCTHLHAQNIYYWDGNTDIFPLNVVSGKEWGIVCGQLFSGTEQSCCSCVRISLIRTTGFDLKIKSVWRLEVPQGTGILARMAVSHCSVSFDAHTLMFILNGKTQILLQTLQITVEGFPFYGCMSGLHYITLLTVTSS